MIVVLGLEKILNGETIAAIVGALVGAGIPASGGGISTGSDKPK
jgi:hypothetical protein